MPFLLALWIALSFLKVGGIIDWPWVVVFLPLLPSLFQVVAVAIFWWFLLNALAYTNKRRRRRY